jgi:hypothetical protein
MSLNDYSRILIGNSRVTFQIVASLTDNPGGIIYNCNMFTVQATASFEHASLMGAQLTAQDCLTVSANMKKNTFIPFFLILKMI